ncbi:ABC transporter ATP-binding protein [Bianquea renquensis]|jgi:ATP-binding cassette, subfamily B, bacterial|uniref:ABC transporter ATP-binding protein n=1 Tax=Bianquea renquensis TaxID=2763661 RepID=A0A926DUC0_9FIRM|nr:ABC transporter ATP-binding protein [Bianquea renquensis]MBC8543957.1 ABC transporter ATP-binding protein [Bianquea renquensis]
MWKYVKRYLHFAILAALFMVGEVLMDLIQPGLMSHIVDDGVLGLNNGGVGNLNLIWKLGIQMIGLVLFGGLCGSLNNVFVHLSGQNIGNDIRKDSFRNIMTFSFPQLDKFGTGSLVTRVTNDITQVQNFVSQFVRGMIRMSLLMFGSMYCMFRLNREFGLIVLCAFPFIVGCLAFCLSRANPLFSKLQAQLDSINEIMQEDVSGIRIIKACVREIYEKARFRKANDELIKTQLKVLVIFAFMNPIINALMYIVVAIILLVGSFEVSGGGATPGTIMAAITYTTQLLNGILMLVMLFQNISRGIASWKRVKEILHSKQELVDGSLSGETEQHGTIEFRDVSFSYPETGQVVLDHINLTVHQGETVGIMGTTGCGKTTLVNLIPRFYDVTGGAILVDGVDVRDYEQKALREKVAIALQKSELFSTSIKENISWGSPSATEEAVQSAAHTAQADDFISLTPNGYDTIVAERGVSLSGGQKQRLSIARAVLKPAEILIFDDATSALDLKTESNLYKALQKTKPESTKIIIAQRIASVRGADRIAVLENGKIAACGSHEELMKSCATYQDIYHSQIGEEAENHE